MHLALLQADIAFADPKKNIKQMTEKIHDCMKAADKPDVILLPEMWNTSFAMNQIEKLADCYGSPSAEAMRELAKGYHVNIVAGSIADKREGKVYNTSYVFDREGKTIAMYDKVHLFDLMDESKHITPGNKRTIFELDGIKCGVILCYDLRFPELARAYALEGVKILFIPAQFPQPRFNPWNVLVQARAIENQIFLVGINRVGTEGKAVFFGSSLIVEPQGDVLARGSEKEEIIKAEIDISKVDLSQNYMTCLKDRVTSAYL